MAQERLDRILCGTGRYTRAEARSVILSGSVTADGIPVRRPETKVSRSSRIAVGGTVLDTAEFVYYMMNKPTDTVSATKDEKYPAVTNLLPEHLRRRGLFPVGRLDADVTGLLILTDDGAYAHRVTSPRREIRKVYEIHADGPLTAADAAALADGVEWSDGTQYRPAVLEIDPTDDRLAFVTVTEGKYHEVKNLIAFCGRKVLSMRRLSIGGLRLDETLEPGQYRQLTPEEAESCFL